MQNNITTRGNEKLFLAPVFKNLYVTTALVISTKTTYILLVQLSLKITTKIGLKINAKHLKFIFSEKATKIDEIFTLDLPFITKCQIDFTSKIHE